MFLTRNLFWVEGKAVCSFIEASTYLIPLHVLIRRAIFHNHELTKIKLGCTIFFLFFSPIVKVTCINIYHVMQKKYYKYLTKILRHSSLWRLLMKISKFSHCNVNVVEKIDYDKNMITKIANNYTFGAFAVIFLEGMRIFISLKV